MRIIIIISLFYLYGLSVKADNLLPDASFLLNDKKETDKLVMMNSTKAKKMVLNSYDQIIGRVFLIPSMTLYIFYQKYHKNIQEI